MIRPALLLSLAVALVAGLSACDSNDAAEPSPADIAGTYDLSDFRFRANASAIGTVDLRDTLNVETSNVRFLNSGQVVVNYEFQGGDEQVLVGQATVREDDVRVRFGGDTEDARERLLLPEDLTFERNGTTLSASTSTRVDLEAFSGRFGDDGTFDDVAGTLTLTLTPRVSG